jgi:acyl-CoA-dependent ceramide synthase
MLLAGSYSYRQWRAGNAILACMNSVDIILPLAKVLRYASL